MGGPHLLCRWQPGSRDTTSAHPGPTLGLPALARVPWYGWTGGLLGVGYVLTITWSLKRVGAANLFALVVAGQLVTALLLDQAGWLGLERSTWSLSKLVGVALLVGGAYLINRP